MKSVALNVFQSMLRSGDGIVRGAAFAVSVPGYTVPIALMVRAIPSSNAIVGCPVVFCFHGAVDREKRMVPVFDGRFIKEFRNQSALVIAIADPMLALYPALRTTWYAGGEILDTPRLLHILITAISEGIDARRVIFASGSTGGHAAMTQAWMCRGSVCVVGNPIASISLYHKRHVNEYRSSCWPGLVNDEWPGGFIDSVSVLYSERCNCSLIYLCNASDPHFWKQATEFLYAIRQCQERQNILFLSDYHPTYRPHAIPPALLARWVAAACEAVSTSVSDIADCAHNLFHSSERRVSASDAGTPNSKSISATLKDDLIIAGRILELAESSSNDLH